MIITYQQYVGFKCYNSKVTRVSELNISLQWLFQN